MLGEFWVHTFSIRLNIDRKEEKGEIYFKLIDMQIKYFYKQNIHADSWGIITWKINYKND